MADPDEKAINNLISKVNSYASKVSKNEENLGQYLAYWYIYNEKLEILKSANTSIEVSIDYFETARSELENRTEGSRSNQAKELFDTVIAAVANLSVSGVETINIYIATAMKILDEQWAKEFKKYEKNLKAYNETVTDLKGYGVTSYKKIEQLYTDNRLIY